MTEEIPLTRLYLITPPAFDPVAFADSLAVALDASDIACVQLRLKTASDDTILRAIDYLRPVCHDRDVALLVNDRPDLAQKGGCDGTHVGQEDMAYSDARALLGDDAIIGVTCHNSRHLAMEAAEGGASYVAFGAFFPTATKETPHHAAADLLDWWSSLMEIPCVAIGGISAENCGPLVRAGADFLAVCSAIWDHPQGPAAAVKELTAAIHHAYRAAGEA